MVWFRGVQRSKAFWFTTWCFFFLMLTFSFSAGVRHFFLYFFMHVGVTLGAVQKLRWQIFGFFWPPNPLRWQFLPDKSWHFWTTYPLFLVNVVCERQIELILSGVFWFFPLHAFLKKQQGDNCTHALNRSFLNEQFCQNSSFFSGNL